MAVEITEEFVWQNIPRRARDSHKGTFGTVLAVAGSAYYRGAALLAAVGALRSGSGIVTLASVEPVLAAAVARTPECCLCPCIAGAEGGISPESIPRIQRQKATVLLLGPGLGGAAQSAARAAETCTLVQTLLPAFAGSAVLDADGLNAAAQLLAAGEAFPHPAGELIVTPHPGEMARLTGLSAAQINADREETARTYAQKWNAVVVLKGSRTVVAAPDGRACVNPTGNPGLARGGSGSYRSAEIERKQVFGVTFEQGRNELNIDEELLSNFVTKNKEVPEEALIDMKIALITLKYTQSNSVCYVKGGQAIGIGAGQQSRIHCTRLAGQKADNWWLRQSPQVLGLQFVDGLGRADRDNAIDVYMGDEYEDVLADGVWQTRFKVKPAVFTREEKRAWLNQLTDVTLGSDAFFPFSDNIERAHKSGVKYIAQPGGSVRDDAVIECCDKYDMAMVFTGIRLFHH